MELYDVIAVVVYPLMLLTGIIGLSLAISGKIGAAEVKVERGVRYLTVTRRPPESVAEDRC